MNLKPLPRYINVTNYDSALTIADALERWTGRKRPAQLTLSNDRRTELCYVLYIGDDFTSWNDTVPKSDYPTVSSLADFLDKFDDKPITIRVSGLDYTIEATTVGAKFGCTTVPWDTVDAIAAMRPKDPLAQLDQLKTQLRSEFDAREYRILGDDEKGFEFKRCPEVFELECFQTDSGNWSPDAIGFTSTATYRTKLTRDELAAKRRGESLPWE